MAITLRQVAKQAGVSLTTASLVLNGKSKSSSISPATTKAVLEVARNLNYRPLGSAKALLRGRTDCIGLLSLELAEVLTKTDIFSAMLAKINDLFHQKDMNTIMFNVDDKAMVVPKMIRERHTDGLIVVHGMPAHLVRELSSLSIPLIYLNMAPPMDYDAVLSDDADGMTKAVDHLVELGHRRILYLNKGSMYEHYSMGTRLRTFYEVMRRHGLEPYPGSDVPLGNHKPDWEQMPWLRDVEEFLFENLSRPADERPTAVIAYHGLWLRKVMLAAKRARLRVPEDISLICFNQMQLVTEWIPAITHVRIPTERMAELAVEMLERKIEGHNVHEPVVYVPEELKVMESTGPAPHKPLRRPVAPPATTVPSEA